MEISGGSLPPLTVPSEGQPSAVCAEVLEVVACQAGDQLCRVWVDFPSCELQGCWLLVLQMRFHAGLAVWSGAVGRTVLAAQHAQQQQAAGSRREGCKMRVWVRWTARHMHSTDLQAFDASKVGRVECRDETGQAYLSRAGASDNEAPDGKRPLKFVAVTYINTV